MTTLNMDIMNQSLNMDIMSPPLLEPLESLSFLSIPFPCHLLIPNTWRGIYLYAFKNTLLVPFIITIN